MSAYLEHDQSRPMVATNWVVWLLLCSGSAREVLYSNPDCINIISISWNISLSIKHSTSSTGVNVTTQASPSETDYSFRDQR